MTMTMSTAMEAEGSITASPSKRRKKIDSEESQSPSSSSSSSASFSSSSSTTVGLKNETSEAILAPRSTIWFPNQSAWRMKPVNPKAEGFEISETEISMNEYSEDTTAPTTKSEICGGSEELESPREKRPRASKSLRRRMPWRRSPPEGKIPTAVEIDEFFAEAEKYEAERFVRKYNYDVVRDVPLPGRYQWVSVKAKP